MEYQIRKYPLFSACGLNCGLCPRFYTDGKSKCPGCYGKEFLKVHPSCGVLTCCQLRGIEYCFLCEEFPCEKYEGVELFDSFITHKNQLVDLDKAKELGIDKYQAELNEKISLLKSLLQNYDDGRRKSFYCVAINLLDLQDIKTVMKQIEKIDINLSLKEKAVLVTALFEDMAEKRGISLKLRKKS